ncbi:MAG: HAMP domain-containing sensor histidine kinase [Phycisphaerae bacterium]
MILENAEQLHERTLVGRVAWLIKLRWLAIIALIATLLAVDEILSVRLPLHAKVLMLGIVLVIIGYNFLLYRRLRQITEWVRIDPARAVETAKRLTHIQILADLICLTIILDLAGGLINPLCIFMIFHVAIAGIILPRREAFFVALLASLLLVIMGIAGAVFPWARIPLAGFPLEHVHPPLTQNWFYILSLCFAFAGTFFLISYFTTGVSFQLREALDDIESANESLRRQDEMLSRFMRTAAHQLRSPLTAIISLINAHLTTDQIKTLPDPYRDLLKRIEYRSRALMSLVDDLLRLTQIREGLDRQEEVSVIDLNRVIAESTGPFKLQAQEKGLQFNVSLDPTPSKIQARVRDITDIIENLVSNAIKYTDAGQVSVEGRTEGDQYRLTVSDTGIGIPENDQVHLFEEFFRAGNAHKKDAHSSGLGLNIAQAIVTRLQGQIHYVSKMEEGTTFTVDLPLLK